MRLLWHAGAFVLGAAVALACVAVHRTAVLQLPLGLVLALAAAFAVPWAMAEWPAPRGLAASYAAGWVVLLGLVVVGRREGDYAIAGDLDGYALLAMGFLLLIVGVSSLGTTRR